MNKHILVLFLGTFSLTACVNSVEPTLLPVPTSLQSTEAIVIESTSGPTEALPLDAAEQLVDLARLNLAQWLSIPVEMIELVNVEAVEWPDASLGCPQEGMTYTQVITPGYFILLKAFSQLFPYHTDLDEKVFLCETTSTPGYPTLPPAKDADDRTPWQPVDPLPTVQP